MTKKEQTLDSLMLKKNLLLVHLQHNEYFHK